MKTYTCDVRIQAVQRYFHGLSSPSMKRLALLFQTYDVNIATGVCFQNYWRLIGKMIV
jgi:hypothetical protein